MANWRVEVHEIYYVWVEADTEADAIVAAADPENWVEVEKDETHDIEVGGEAVREDDAE